MHIFEVYFKNLNGLKFIIAVMMFVISANSSAKQVTKLYITNNKTSVENSYLLGEEQVIPIGFIKGWKSCNILKPRSKYIKELNSHVRQYFVACYTDSYSYTMIGCSLPDGKSNDSSFLQLFSNDYKYENDNIVSGNSVNLSIICVR